MITERSFGYLTDNTEIKKITLTNNNGIKIETITYGGIITALKIPDKNGNLEDVVLGYDEVESYLEKSHYFGAIVGRFGNRIAKGKFKIDKKEYTLATNDVENHLHGGIKGFDKVVWDPKLINKEDGVGVKFSYTSKDGEEGYPGTLQVEVAYFLGNDNTLEFNYKATTDKKTIVNLTQHNYYNLTGGKENILNHQLKIKASKITPIDESLITTGELQSVEKTPFDFKKAKPIGQDINATNEQLKFAKGYDHNFVLDKDGESMALAATVYEPKSGRFVEIFTTEPGVQFYSGNFLDESLIGKKGTVYKKNFGFCLETQHFPDSPNKPEFPSTLLEPGEDYSSTTKIRFSVK